MTKPQARQIEMIKTYLAQGMHATAARSLSALIRSAMRRQDIAELRAFAESHGLSTHPDFIA